MTTLAEAHERATRELLGGDPEAALWTFAQALAHDPGNLDARLRVADSLRALGAHQEAAAVYTAVARYATHAGYPLRGLVALKLLAELAPELEALFSKLAELYCAESPRLGRTARPSLPDLGGSVELSSERPALETLIAKGFELGRDLERVADVYPSRLPPLPILSLLPADAFAAVLGALRLIRYAADEVVIKQGDQACSFFMVARGSVQVTRQDQPTPLATLYEGAIFGEMALVSAAPRSATVRTLEDTDLLEWDCAALQAAGSRLDVVANALENFTSERLLRNVVATSPLFRPLDGRQRMDLMRRFVPQPYAEGASVVVEGQRGTGIYVVMSGEVTITKHADGAEAIVATLGPGDVFGEISIIADRPSTASATTGAGCTLLFLAREYVERLVDAIPSMREYFEELASERLMQSRRLMDLVGAVSTDEG